ncbi:hypothetical protein [Acetivibrio cellulolyticus]|uniref:hypothetical protein n=1 Tax=Acetivibrio cellulolyticus TaxID=35830 RepID=UPI0001E2E7A2|nr:hypothetical protein [Acetivibrio cellulolyticus]
MEYLKHEEICYCTLFDIKLSQDELEVFESCMRFVKEHCNQEEIYKLTGCTEDEFCEGHSELRELIIKYVRSEILPDRYNENNG